MHPVLLQTLRHDIRVLHRKEGQRRADGRGERPRPATACVDDVRRFDGLATLRRHSCYSLCSGTVGGRNSLRAHRSNAYALEDLRA